MEVLVLGVKRYSFKNDQNEQVEGTKVHYVDLKGEVPKDTIGTVPASTNLPYSAYGEFKSLPAIYELEMGITLRGGKPVVQVTGVEYVSQAEVTY